ncbi:hypothetical protein VULLAG_LOCUS15063 [Vulpes lagopus]
MARPSSAVEGREDCRDPGARGLRAPLHRTAPQRPEPGSASRPRGRSAGPGSAWEREAELRDRRARASTERGDSGQPCLRRPPVRPGGARPAARRRGSEARCSGRAAGEVRPTEADLKKSERVECKFRQPGLSHPRSSAYEIMPLGKLLNQFKLQQPHL